jgi:hypothetical protein
MIDRHLALRAEAPAVATAFLSTCRLDAGSLGKVAVPPATKSSAMLRSPALQQDRWCSPALRIVGRPTLAENFLPRD